MSTWIFFARTPFCQRTMLRTYPHNHNLNGKLNCCFNISLYRLFTLSSYLSMSSQNYIIMSSHQYHHTMIFISSNWEIVILSNPIHSANPPLGSSRPERDVRPTPLFNSLQIFFIYYLKLKRSYLHQFCIQFVQIWQQQKRQKLWKCHQEEIWGLL